MAVVYAVGKWRHYLLGNNVLIKIDHQSLKYLLDQTIKESLLQINIMDYQINGIGL